MTFLQLFYVAVPFCVVFMAIAFYIAQKWANEDTAFQRRLIAPGVSQNGGQMYFTNYQMPCRPISKDFEGSGRELMR